MAWFVYRHLLYKESRQELLADLERLKNRIVGEIRLPKE